MKKRKKWLLGIIAVVVIGLIVGMYILFFVAGTGSITVGELKSRTDSPGEQHLRVEGKVAPGSVDWDNSSEILRFTLTGGGESLAVVYQGVVPDEFKPGTDLVVVGNYGQDGVFSAIGLGSPQSVCSICH